MLSAIAIAASLAALPPPSGDEVAWYQPNGEATYVATQTADGAGCHFQMIHDADKSVLWEVEGCFGGKSDKHFVSKDGERLIVVAALPSAGGKDAAGWRKTTVAWLFHRGELVATAVAGQFVKDGSMVRREVSHFTWLQGVNRVPGVPPHLSDAADTVELDGIDGTHAILGFDGFKLHAPYSDKPKKKTY